jgi:hypothetical protein
MNKAKLLSELDDLTDIEADFQGWICYNNRYDPATLGYDLVVEILELHLESIDTKRAKEILKTEAITAGEQESLKSYVLDEVRSSGEESYWIGDHPDAKGKVLVGLYQDHDGSREVADLFESEDAAKAYGKTAGFDLAV